MDRIKNRITNNACRPARQELGIRNKKILFLYSFLILNSIFLIRSASAAQLTFETSTTTIAVGDTMTLHVKLNTEGASINAIDLGILYPAILSVKTISKSGSFIQIWVKEPGYTSSAIFLSGGVPNGIVSGNGNIITVTFEAKSVGDGALGLSPTSAVLLNDGSGTSAPLSLRTPNIHVVPRKANQSPKVVEENAPIKDETKSDFIRPNKFNLLVGSDANLFKGKYFVSFFTTDAGTGVDHYELKEGDSPYAIAQSPYLLSDQTLHSVIRVRAYDGSGNYQEAVYPNWFKRFLWWLLKIFGH